MSPLLSVVCIAYNQERFIRQCLDGILMQETDFAIEILVHDDASSDKTASIIQEYEVKYPGRMHCIYEKENQFSKGVRIGASIMYPMVKGRYVAICEGDDYWTDPHKLQKQIEYMESHSDCSFCFHNAIVRWEDGDKPDSVFADMSERDYTGDELLDHWSAPTASFLFRADVLKDYACTFRKYRNLVVGDTPMAVFCSQYGKVHSIPEVMSVYRKHRGGYTGEFDSRKLFLFGLSWEEVRDALNSHYYGKLTSIMTGFYINSFLHALRERNLEIAFKALYRGFLKQPLVGGRAFLKLPMERRMKSKKSML